MKVQAEKIVEFLDQLKALAEGIKYTIQCGDDGFEQTVNYQVDEIAKAIELYKLEQLTPVTPIEPAQKKHSRIYDDLAGRNDLEAPEAKQLYKSELYFALKRLIKQFNNLSDVTNNDLMNMIEGLVPDDSKYKRLIYSNELYYSSMEVIQEVAAEIIEQRRKAPQAKLF